MFPRPQREGSRPLKRGPRAQEGPQDSSHMGITQSTKDTALSTRAYRPPQVAPKTAQMVTRRPK
eukprot:4443553-Pyramimonas_sp.AAC.1